MKPLLESYYYADTSHAASKRVTSVPLSPRETRATPAADVASLIEKSSKLASTADETHAIQRRRAMAQLYESIIITLATTLSVWRKDSSEPAVKHELQS